MDARRQIHCPTCTIEFTLDVPRTWVRCPSCGHGFVVKRISRELDAAAPKSARPISVRPPERSGWQVTGPDGVVHRFEKVDDLREAIVRGDLEDPEPESAPMDVSMSEIEVAAPSVEAIEEVVASSELIADSEAVVSSEAVASSDVIASSEVVANEPSGHEIAPGVAVVPLDALERLERRSDAPPSGERDRATPAQSSPPASLKPAALPSIRPVVEDVTEFVDNADIDDLDDDAAEVEPKTSSIEETPLLLSTQTRTPTLPPPSPVVVPKKKEPTKELKKEAKKEPKKEAKNEAKKEPASERKTATSVARSVEPETPSRSWTLPLLGAAAIGAIAWTFMGPSKTPEPNASAAATAATTAAPSDSTAASTPDPIDPPVVINPQADAAVMVIPATTAISPRLGSPTDTTPHVAASASSAPARALTPGGDGGGADAVAQRAQAASAFRAGDFPRARTIYEQIVAKNALDVEAWSALGDAARAQGSMADAESAYRRALGVNPRYLPSLIGLADIGWDNGDKAGAQKRYADLTERFPLDMLPERVKTRAAQ